MIYQHEENNYPKAFAATGVILAVIMALCYFIVFTNPPRPEDGTGGILVNYGTTDEGMGSDYMSTEQPSMSEKANNTKPDKITPAPPTEQKTQVESSDKNVVTQNTEDAPEVAANSKKPSTTVTQATKPVVKQTVYQPALFKGMSNNGIGSGDGTTNTPGNQGKPTGSNLTDNYNGTGSGNGGLSGLGQRSFVIKPTVNYTGRLIGVVKVRIRVDKNGNVIDAVAGVKGSTLIDSELLDKCERAARNSKVSALLSAPDVQEGVITFNIKTN